MDNILVASVADVVAFVRSGLTSPGLTVSVLAKKLYFIEHIAVTAVYGDGSAKAIPNDNWFWRTSNNKNRFELAADIEKCVDFNDMDTNYQKIITRYEKADAYGIVKPVKKVFFGSVDKKIFDMIVKNYQLDTTERECYKKSEHYFKLKYCYESNATFEEFVSWVVAEKILGLSLNLIQAGVVDGAIYGDIDELVNAYMTDEYFDIVGEMKRLYSLHVGSRTNLSDRYVDQGLTCKAANDYLGFVTEQKKIEFLWEPPDGAFETERRYYEGERKKYLERLGKFENL